MGILERGLEQLNFSAEKIARLVPSMQKYIEEILLFNSAYNLVNTSSRDEIAARHILDSLAAAPIVLSLAKDRASTAGRTSAGSAEAGGSKNRADFPCPVIADIGSGGGLPGIPLAAFFLEHKFQFELVERMSKRCAFLENAAAILGLQNARVNNASLEKLPPQSFDIAVFRAFRPLEKDIFASLMNVIKSGGYLVAYKAKEKNIIEEMSALGISLEKLAPDLASEAIFQKEAGAWLVPLFVPFLTDINDTQNARTKIEESRERNLVVIKK